MYNESINLEHGKEHYSVSEERLLLSFNTRDEFNFMLPLSLSATLTFRHILYIDNK